MPCLELAVDSKCLMLMRWNLWLSRGILRGGRQCRHLRGMATQGDDASAGTSEKKTSDGTVTAGIIIIGDEILKGYTQDINSFYMCKKLRSLGVQVAKISVIPDEVDAIAKEISTFASTYTYVLTSGGIGPTHDDVTFEAVAQAFGEKVFPHPDMVELVKQFFGKLDAECPEMKLARVPESSLLNYGVDKTTGRAFPYPLVSVRNVYIFPGIPALMKRALEGLGHLFLNEKTRFCSQEIYVNAEETLIAPVLTQANASFGRRTSLGSYPDWGSNYFRVKLTLDSDSKVDLEEAYSYLMEKLPDGVVVPVVADPVSRAASDVLDFSYQKKAETSGSSSEELEEVRSDKRPPSKK
ncbi:FAD synthase-like [Sceloporus undulatus]|uniref:FAD synthase-like n=1 Tax=Sceloporus undulatus TaxID=8520 RepID=UPI001C4D1AA8|nr:FAD synthase-like [Sceloporus undulatus]